MALLLLLLLATPAAAEQAAELLQRMNHAVHALDYVGTLVYGERGRMETLRIYHAGGQPERERLVSLTGELREVVREDGRVTCIGLGDGDAVTFPAAPTLPSLPVAAGAAASPHYALSVAGAGRIAGRDAVEVAIEARDAFRYSHRAWLDRETGMLLKAVRVGADGATVDQLMFTDIAIGQAPPEADLRPSGAAQPLPSVPATASLAPERAHWTVRDLPPGFTLMSVATGPGQGEEHQVYSDGLASVSVYVEPAADAEPVSPASSRGAISVFSRRNAGFRVVVIGDVPERTVQRIAHGVVARG